MLPVPIPGMVQSHDSYRQRRSRLGSLSEGAAERSEAEGVYYNEWYELKRF